MYFKHQVLNTFAKVTDESIVKVGYNSSMISLTKSEDVFYKEDRRNIFIDWQSCLKSEFNNAYLETLKNLQDHANITNNQQNC